MTAETECWEKYGFPDPTLYPPYLPFVGIAKALNERIHLWSDSPYMGFVPVPDYFEPASVLSALRDVDTRIDIICRAFLNPEKYPDISYASDMFWTPAELLLAGAEGVEENIIYTDTGRRSPLTPEFPAEWLKQRYRMINLLRFKRIDLSTDQFVADYSRGRTMEAAFYAAVASQQVVSTGREFCQFSGVITAGLEYLCGYGILKSCSVHQYAQLNASNPTLLLYAEPFGDFYTFGHNISQGWNRIQADSSGVFLNIDSVPYPPTWTADSPEYYYSGWEPYYSLFAYADFNDTFNFKEVSA